MAAPLLNRFPFERNNLTPAEERWYTALVLAVNNLDASRITDEAAIAANTAAIALLQPVTGTWTPVDSSGAGLALSNVEGVYLKLGLLTFAWGFWTYPATASGAAAQIGGLPFTVHAQTNGLYGSIVAFNDANIPGLMSRPLVGGTTNFFYTPTGAVVTNVQLTLSTTALTVVYRATA